MMSRKDTFDLVVVGSGIAGLVTATTAAEAGMNVCLVEKRASIGGSSAMSGGWFAFSGTAEQLVEGIDDSAELFRKDLLQVGAYLNDERLIDAYLEHQHKVYRWLLDHGVEFREVAISSGQSAPRGHLSDIKTVLRTLHDSFSDAGGTTYFNARAQELIKDEDRVTGLDILLEGGVIRLRADRGVVLATGGFTRSAELLKIFAPEQLAALPYGGPANTGDGLIMGWQLGASLADMYSISGTYGSHPETTDAFHELLTAYYEGAIIVNREGLRFTDESQSYKTLGRAVLDETDGLGFQIFDANIRAKSQPGVPLADIDALEEIGHVYSAESLDELADIAGIDPDSLKATVSTYNEIVQSRAKDPLGRESLCNGVGKLVSIDQAPYFAYPAKSLMTSTYCGLKVTPEGEVVDVQGRNIEGLFAAGEVVGGFHGAAYMTGTSLGKGAVFGHKIASEISSDKSEAR